jgi:3-deoxy-7-phosphoheptulonate synthase
MIITIRKSAPEIEVEKLIHELESLGIEVTYLVGENHDILGLVGDTANLDEKRIQANDAVHKVTRLTAPYKLANRLFHPEDTVVDVAGIKVGGRENIVIIGGPCSVEGKEQIESIAHAVKQAGAVMLRGGAYKPRTSPYAFQGLQTEGILAMVEARRLTGLPIVSELMSADKLEEFEQYVDLIQVGARNMQNFELLKALGKTKKPVLLKRGLANTIEEWIMSAEYIMAAGNPNVILCERGIRTFEKYTRNTLDLSVIPVIKEKTHLPMETNATVKFIREYVKQYLYNEEESFDNNLENNLIKSTERITKENDSHKLKISSLEKENEELLSKNNSLEKTNDEMLNSKSWKLTKPLRAFINLFR